MKYFAIPQSDIEEIISFLDTESVRFAGKTILITGAGGFLGRYFFEVFARLNKYVFAQPCKVLLLDNLITAGDIYFADDVTDTNIQFVKHDVTLPYSTDDSIDYIIHAAGIASPYYYRKYPLQTLDVATLGTRNMLELARQKHISGIVFFSSSEIYGDPDPKHVPIKESYRGNVSCIGSRACYDESKRLGETLCKIYQESYGVPTKIVRPFNVYGPGMRENDYRVLPQFASKILANKQLNIYGSGHQTRTFCYITDAINGFLRVLLDGIPGEPYNIGNSSPEISMTDLVNEVGIILQKKIDYTLIEYPDSYPSDEPMRRCPDLTKAKLQLQYHPYISLHDGLKRYFGWALQTYTGNVE